jgi:hypothetical protein
VLSGLPSVVTAQPEGRGAPRGGRGGLRGFETTGLLDQVRRGDVQTELKLTPEQIERVKDLAENGPRVNPGEFFGRMRDATPEQQASIREEWLAKREEIRKAQDSKVKEILSPDQLARAEQLVLQRLGPPALNGSEVAQKLGLSDAQKEQVRSIIQTAAEKTAALGFRGPQEERAKIASDRDAELLKLLSADQKKTWEASLGTPFEVLADRTAGGTGFRRAQPSSNSPSTAAPGSSGRLASRASGNSLGLLEEVCREHVQTELKLTPEQIQKVNDLVENGPRADFSEFFARLREATPEQQASIREEMYAKREASRKTLDSKVKEILSPDQLGRAEQLVLQRLGPPALNRSEVAQKLGLSEEQKKQVASIIQTAAEKNAALGFRGPQEERAKITADRDAELLKLLSADQRKNWTASLGSPLEPMAERGGQRAAPAPAIADPAAPAPAVAGRRAAPRFFPERGGLLDEVRREHVQTELKLTAEQIQKVADLVENGPRADLRDLLGRMRDATPEQVTAIRDEARAKMDEARKAQDVKVKAILSPEQLSRAEQLVLQDLGVLALNRGEVAQKVGLSKEQQNRVAAIIQTADEKMRELGFRGSREERAKITSDRDSELLETLTEEQAKTWKDSLGPPREVQPRQAAPAPLRNQRRQSSPPPPSARMDRLRPKSSV